MATSVDQQTQQLEIGRTAASPFREDEIRTAINATLKSRGKTSTRTAMSAHSEIGKGPGYEQIGSDFALAVFSYILVALSLYVEAAVALFHLAYFSYRNPAESKKMLKTTYHNLKTSYDNNLLTLSGSIEIIQNTIKLMARENIQFHLEGNERTAQLQTMKTSSAISS